MKAITLCSHFRCCLATVESDAFALMMLLVIFFSIGMVGLLVMLMRYKARQRDPHVDALIEELTIDSNKEKSSQGKHHSSSPTARADWEQDPDWWKSKNS